MKDKWIYGVVEEKERMVFFKDYWNKREVYRRSVMLKRRDII